MALNVKDASEMCRTARQTGRRLAVAYFRRFWPRFQLIKDMLDNGKFGQVVLVRIASHTWYQGRPGGWRENPAFSGGGVLSDVGCHKFDLLAWWFDLPQRLVADVQTLTHGYSVEDSATMLMTLAGGTQFTGSFNWNSKTWTDEIHVVGTEAKVTLHPCDGDEAVVTMGRDVERRKIANPENQHYPLIDDFARSIVEDRQPRFTGSDGMKATQIMDTVFESSRKQKWAEVRTLE
jgi:predicted dehydrogenase